LFLLICFASFSQQNKDSLSLIQDKIVVVKDFVLSGNKDTKSFVILKESTIKQGDSLLVSELLIKIEKTRENILNTSLFNFVTINFTYQTDKEVVINIAVIERWYWWPYPILEHADRNFSSWLKNEEWDRVNYGLFILKNNFRGRNETLKIKFRLGYKQQYEIFYNNPNILNKKHGIGIGVDYFQQNEIASSTKDNKQVYLKTEDHYILTNKLATINYYIRSGLYLKNIFTFVYSDTWADTTILKTNSQYLGDSISSSRFFTASYSFFWDKRDSKVYPIYGNYFKFDILKRGFKCIDDDLDLFSVKLHAAKYLKFTQKLSFSTELKGQYSTSSIPYYLNSGLGYKDFMHGYEYYVIDGENYGALRTNFKCNLVKPSIVNIDFIHNEKFGKAHYAVYFNLFVDAGYVNKSGIIEKSNTFVNSYLYSAGVGIDFVTYYDKILRIEYSVNKNGESGVFLHFGAPIFSD